jgi:hypothetical protein
MPQKFPKLTFPLAPQTKGPPLPGQEEPKRIVMLNGWGSHTMIWFGVQGEMAFGYLEDPDALRELAHGILNRLEQKALRGRG